MSIDKQFATRREFFARGSHLLGSAALASLAGQGLASLVGSGATTACGSEQAARLSPRFAPQMQRVIYLRMVGGPTRPTTHGCLASARDSRIVSIS